MRRTLSLIALLASITGLAACSGGGTLPSTQSQSQSQSRTAQDSLHPII